MPQVPFTNDGPSVRVGGTINSSASPADFGGSVGTAESQMGASLNQDASDFGAVAQQRQTINNEIEANNLDNHFATQASKILRGDPNDPNAPKGYLTQLGSNAVNGLPAVQQSFNDLREQTVASASNDRVRVLLNNIVRRRSEITDGQIGDHFDQQQKVYLTQTATASADNAMADAVANYNDPGALNTNIANVRSQAMTQQSTNGWSDDTREQWIRAKSSPGVLEIFHRQMLDNTSAAIANLPRLSALADGPTQLKMQELAHPAQQNLAATAAADRALGGGSYNPGQLPGLGSASAGSETGTGGGDSDLGKMLGVAGAPGPASGPMSAADVTAKLQGMGLAPGAAAPGAPASGVSPSAPPGVQNFMNGPGGSSSAKPVTVSGMTLAPNQQAAMASYGATGGDPASVLTLAGGDHSVVPAAMAAPLATTPGGFNSPELIAQRAQQVQAYTDGSFPDEGTAMSRLHADPAMIADPALMAMAEARVRRQVSDYKVTHTADRENLTRSLQDVAPALLAGTDTPIPYARILANFEPEKAAEIVGDLEVKRAAGQIYKGLQFADPATIRSAMDDLTSGSGPISKSIGPSASGSDDESANFKIRHEMTGLLQHRLDAMKGDDAQSFADRQTALKSGQDVPVDEANIRALYGDKADEKLAILNADSEGGKLYRAIPGMTTADATAAIQAYSEGTARTVDPTSRKSAALAGVPEGQDGVVVQGDPQSGQTTPAPQNVEGLRERRGVANELVGQLQKRDAALAADPALFVASHSLVTDAANGTFADHANAVMAVQKSLGVPASQQHILTVSQAAQATANINAADPTKDDVGAMLNDNAKKYGSAWPQVWSDMVTLGKVKPEYQVLATMDHPSQGGARIEMQRALQEQATDGAKYGDSLGKDVIAGMDKDIPGALDPFYSTISMKGLSSNDALRNQAAQSVKTLAIHYAMQGEASPVQRATDDIFSAKYNFDGAMRLPKDITPDAAKSAGFDTLSALKPSDLAAPDSPNLSPQDQDILRGQRIGDLSTAAKNASWVTNEKGDGLIAVATLNGGGQWPVMTANGQRLEMKFDDIRSGTVKTNGVTQVPNPFHDVAPAGENTIPRIYRYLR